MCHLWQRKKEQSHLNAVYLTGSLYQANRATKPIFIANTRRTRHQSNEIPEVDQRKMARFVPRHQIRTNTPSHSSWANDALPITRVIFYTNSGQTPSTPAHFVARIEELAVKTDMSIRQIQDALKDKVSKSVVGEIVKRVREKPQEVSL